MKSKIFLVSLVLSVCMILFGCDKENEPSINEEDMIKTPAITKIQSPTNTSSPTNTPIIWSPTYIRQGNELPYMEEDLPLAIIEKTQVEQKKIQLQDLKYWYTDDPVMLKVEEIENGKHTYELADDCEIWVLTFDTGYGPYNLVSMEDFKRMKKESYIGIDGTIQDPLMGYYFYKVKDDKIIRIFSCYEP